jgi:hypothetical protein
MRERRRPGEGDITSPTRGDFTDWDNPEDFEELEDAPEGYDDEDLDDEFALDPDDPDYDLSEEAGYAEWVPPSRSQPIPQWVIVAVSILLILALLIPVFRLIG